VKQFLVFFWLGIAFWAIIAAVSAHAAQVPTPIIGYIKTQVGNAVTITYTDSTKSTIATITYSDGTVVTVSGTSTTDVYTRTQ
jgi:hypothetical protein